MGSQSVGYSRYNVPKLWPNSTIFIIGGGPSLIGQDLCLRRKEKYGLEGLIGDQHILGVNNAFLFGDWIDVLFFGDAKFYWWNREAIQKYPSLKISTNIIWPGRDKSIEKELGINIIQREGLRGLRRNPNQVAGNRSSGAMAINVAIHLGAKSIVLLGFDMKNTNGQKNFVKHQWEKTNQDPYEYMIGTLDSILEAANKLKIKIVNATPNSALNIFPKVDLMEII